MGIPTVHSQHELRSFSNAVKERRWYAEPTSIGFVVTEIGKLQTFSRPEITRLQIGGEFDCSGALAAVVHHRSGNEVYELIYVQLKELEQLFRSNADGTDICPQAADVRMVCQQLLASPTKKAFLVFVGPRHPDWRESALSGVKLAVFEKFKQSHRQPV
jgi:hypothetical protein